jgi:hypothetical protein
MKVRLRNAPTRLLLLLCWCLLWCLLPCAGVRAQKPETFEGIGYTLPKGWQKDVGKAAVQMGTDGEKGACLITLFKPVASPGDPKANFEESWKIIVKELVTVSGRPKMQPTGKEDGWTVESGLATYESDGKKGVVLLVTATGGGKMVNVLVLTDTDAYQTEITAFINALRLPKVAADDPEPAKGEGEKPGKAAPAAPRKSGYQFSSTNFDDGWTAVEQEAWVRVTKGNLTVLVHYPDAKADARETNLEGAWNLLVAPRYANVREQTFRDTRGFERVLFAEAQAVDRATGKTVYVVLVKKFFNTGNGRWLEFVSPTRADYEKEFGPYRDQEFGWEKVTDMEGRNRFAVGVGDLTGTWSTSSSASLQYYYVDSGRSAGATATSTADEFAFQPGGAYQSDHAGASGAVGKQKFSRQVYKGKFSTDRWTMTLTNRFRGDSETYNCHFVAVKGGRILILTDRRGGGYTLVKK